MKNVFYFIFVLLLSCSNESVNVNNLEKSQSILFVGNSYTFFNNMPQLIKDMASSTNDNLIFEMHTPGGSTISQHANSEELANKIKSNDWDHVSIQTQSLESALDQNHFDSNVYPNIEILMEKIKNNSNKTDAIYFMTWGYENGEWPPCAGLPYLCEFESMNDKLTERYTFMAKNTNSILSPVGIVWKNIRTRNPEIQLYNPDESHPSKEGSYLVACTFYTIIFKKDPTLINYNNEDIDDSIELVIKNKVKEIVFKNINEWYYN